ncbi:protein adenylyltransferase SelO [Litchfieldia alkalitelluris]|uniref:protein adenylyltransferase SelO n=1 Tax=Litchfieldia alkalitelluris TaxID=304268 RepID=UPI000998CD68|nr:YdiU family protein [Litchfieldia alkalitelluris]
MLKETGWNLDYSYTRLPETFYTRTNPTPVQSPKLIKLNESLATSLGLNPESLKSEDMVSVFAGNDIPKGASPLAQAYAGHQFGHPNMLGDGRAVLLGEQLAPNDERFDIQLKGSGRTPYSRGGDGRAALGPMLREYIISEAMHALRIPTTRSLAVVSTGELIQRETALPGAILTRVAASHLRVGTFEYAARYTEKEELKALADYTIKRHYPHIEGVEKPYLLLLKEVAMRQAKLISQWQLVGFIHGVMNTDNMTISGETIDYGPCAFMNEYDPSTVFSSIDRQGRYAYGNQPNIGGWNLARFAETLLPLIHDNQDEAVKMAQDEITNYINQYQRNWIEGMRAKLGIFNAEEEDKSLVEDLLNMMQKHRGDFTNTFRSLTYEEYGEHALFNSTEFSEWSDKWKARRKRQNQSNDDSQQLMKDSNPAVIPRNHRVEEALEAAGKGDYTVLERLVQVLSNPFDHDNIQEEYCKLPESTNIPYQTFCGT